MPYNYDKDEQFRIALIDKNDRGDKIQVQSIKNKNTGSESIDIRLMYTPEGTDELRHTSKGVRFNVEMLPDMVIPMAMYMQPDDMEKLFKELGSRLEAMHSSKASEEDAEA